MILNEFFSDETKELFVDVPNDCHKELLDLYFMGFELCRNKPDFIKLSFLELIHIKYLNDSINSDSLEMEIENFCLHYNKILKDKNCEKLNLGFYEDIKDFIWDYLNKE